MRLKLPLAIATGLSLASAATAAGRDGGIVADVVACRAIPEAAARLACFDATADALRGAVDRKEVVVLDRDDVQTTRKRLFGFSLPRLPFFGDDGDDDGRKARGADETIREIASTVRSARPLGYGKWRIAIEDGAVWANTEALAFDDPKTGDPIRIKRATLGSFFMTVGRNRPVKARREN